jgi:hypothetical protein
MYGLQSVLRCCDSTALSLPDVRAEGGITSRLSSWIVDLNFRIAWECFKMVQAVTLSVETMFEIDLSASL